MLPDGTARPNESTDIPGAAPKPKAGPSFAARPGGIGRSASAGSDETLAKEALEGLKRIRAKARLDRMAIPRTVPGAVRPAVIVAKSPAPRPPWVAPLAALVAAIGLVVSVCTGVIAYLATQPSTTSAAANAEIKTLRETVVQLRHQVAGMSENLDGLRTSVDLSSKTTNDRLGRFAQNLDRVERVGSSATAKLDRLAQAQPPAPAPAGSPSQPPGQSAAMVASAAPVAEVTGSVPPSQRASPPRKVVKGWSVRETYEGIAILNGPAGVVETVLGQQVPGLGRIEEIKNENGQLVVLSSAGTILPARRGTP